METIMWRVGHDPTLRMAVGYLMVLDAPPSRVELVERLGMAAELEPRLSRRPEEAGVPGARPAWVDDGEFDPQHHVRVMAVPAPGDLRSALGLVGILAALSFDSARPPWDATIIEGLAGGRALVYLRAHHLLTDGFGGLRLAGLLVDEGARAAPVESIEANPRGAEESDDSSPRPGTITIDLAGLVRPVVSGVAAAWRIDPVGAVARSVQRGVDVASSVSRQMLVMGGPLSSLAPERSAATVFELLSIGGVRRAARALGGSRNDLLVAATAAALGRYHDRLGRPCTELRLAAPASLQGRTGGGGNWFAPTRTAVPTASSPAAPHFGAVRDRLAQARREPALRLSPALAGGINRLPTGLLVRALRAQAGTVDFAATALPGSRARRHLCRAAVERAYALGPRLGCPLNLTALGNDDRLDIGIAIDPTAITEPALLLDCLEAAFLRLGASGGALTHDG